MVGCDQNPKVVADHAPADPALYSGETAIKTAREAVAPLHNADPALASSSHTLAAAKPSLMLLGALFRRRLSNGGYTHPLDAGGLGGRFVGMRPKASIGSEQMWSAAEDLLVGH